MFNGRISVVIVGSSCIQISEKEKLTFEFCVGKQI